MSITPVPPQADLKRNHRPGYVSDTIWTTAQVVTAVASVGGSLIACALAYGSLGNRLEIQARDQALTAVKVEKLETTTAKEFREFRDVNASRDVLLVNIQRDVSEVRAMLERERQERTRR